MWLMFMCMLVTIPMMLQFANFEALFGQAGYSINKFSLGNMGGSMTLCIQVPYTEPNSRLNIHCNTGVINLDSIDAKSGKKLLQTGIINKA